MSNKIISDKILKIINKIDRQFTVGEIVNNLNISLEEAEEVLEDLKFEGLIRDLTKAELKKFDFKHGYILTNKASLSVAYS